MTSDDIVKECAAPGQTRDDALVLLSTLQCLSLSPGEVGDCTKLIVIVSPGDKEPGLQNHQETAIELPTARQRGKD